MDRAQRLEKFNATQLNQKLREVMEILDPGNQAYWGGKKHDQLIAYTACHLAVEYQSLTGLPVVDQLLGEFPTVQEAVGVKPGDDALPL